jgi:hypothetical protein
MNAYQQKTMQVIGRHFGIPRKILTPLVEKSLEEYNQVYFVLTGGDLDDALPAGIKYTAIAASKEKEVNISKLWNWDKLLNTSLYSSYNDTYQNIITQGFECLFTYVHGSDVFVMYPNKEYSGTGGIFVKKEYRASDGIVIEPLKSWLEYYCPNDVC